MKEMKEMNKVAVRQNNPYVAPTCEVVKVGVGDILQIAQASIHEAEDGGEIMDAKRFKFSEEDINMNSIWND